MSKRRRSGLAPEELEIQRVLSPSSSMQTQSADSPVQPGQGRPAPPAQAPPPQAHAPSADLSESSMRQLAQMVSHSMVMALATAGISGLNIGGPIDHVDPPPRGDDDDGDEDDDDNGHDSDGDVDMAELPSGRPVGVNDNVHMDLPSGRPFGAHDGPAPGDVQFGLHANAPPAAPIDARAAAPLEPVINVQPLGPVPVVPAVAGEVLPDASLPLPTSDVSTTWHPILGVLAWANVNIDSSEWVAADREAIEKKFVPEPQFRHIFEAVPTPPDILSAMKSPITKEQDHLFRRYDTENYLYTANKDLTCGLRLLIEVISSLTGAPGQEHNRFLLGQAYQAVSSGISHLSRGRRELGRKFVPLANATALYRRKPSHFSLFGSTDDNAAAQQAAAQSKVNKDLVRMPQRRPQPFRASHPGSKYAGQGYSTQFQKGRYQNQYQSQKGYSGNAGKYPSRGRGGRGKARGKKRRQTKAATQE